MHGHRRQRGRAGFAGISRLRFLGLAHGTFKFFAGMDLPAIFYVMLRTKRIHHHDLADRMGDW